MAAALAEVRQRLGAGAVVLHTRRFRRRGLLGIRGREIVEITAAKRCSGLPTDPWGGMVGPSGRSADAADDDIDEASRADGAAPRATPKAGPCAVQVEGATARVVSVKDDIFAGAPERMAEEINGLRSVVGDDASPADPLAVAPPNRSALPDHLYDAYFTLLHHAVSDDLAEDLVTRVCSALTAEALHDAACVRRALAACLEAMVPEAGGVTLQPVPGPTVAVFVGPTGAGKTTTLAKLAADFSLRKKKRVGLVTIDTYRIAAVEQLRTYADIIGVPLYVAMSPEQLREAIGSLVECDVVLVDTVGRSPRAAARLQEIKEFVAAAAPHEVHLVLPATAAGRQLEESVERFSELGVNRLLFTKLDEAIGFGVILSCLQKAQVGLSYVTTGQEVPHDIEIGRGEWLAEALTGVVAHRGRSERDTGNAR